MVEALGAFFRISLSQGRELIRIKEEVDHVRNYLYIQKLRHGEKYDYRFEVEDGITHYKTLKLLLQPLVENAIYHGVRSTESNDGLIVIKGYRAEETICFEVVDNGRGMPAEMVETINRSLRGECAEEQERYGFGLRNVHERIVLAFGQEYGLWLTSTLNQGTKAVLRLPLIE